MSATLPINVATLAALLVSAVTAAASPPAPDLRAMCPSIYQPVCASRGDERRTFANACLAGRAGFTVVALGRCGGGAGLPRFGSP